LAFNFQNNRLEAAIKMFGNKDWYNRKMSARQPNPTPAQRFPVSELGGDVGSEKMLNHEKNMEKSTILPANLNNDFRNY